MPLYNDEKNVEKAIQSIINQTYKKWELIIVDDGSKDNSYNLAKKYTFKDKRIKLFNFKENKGNWFVRNFGTNKAIYDWVVNIDSDIIAPKIWLKLALSLIERKIDVFGGGVIYPVQKEGYLKKIFYLSETILSPKEDILYNKFSNFKVPPLGGANLFFRKDIFKRLGGFETTLIVGGDSLFCLNAIENDFNVLFSPKLAVKHPLYNFDNIINFIKRSIFFARSRNILFEKSRLMEKPYKKIKYLLPLFILFILISSLIFGFVVILKLIFCLAVLFFLVYYFKLLIKDKIDLKYIPGYMLLDIIKKISSSFIYILKLKPKSAHWK